MSLNLDEFLKLSSSRVDAFLNNRTNNFLDHAPILKDSMRYSLLLGGKRARPFLVYATGKAFNIDLNLLDYPAAAIECIHSFSLVHDDMPEMDNDLLRRGQPAVHAKYGADIALLAGDTLQTLAFEILTDTDFKVDNEIKLNLIKILANATGYDGMCGGQAIDLDSENKQIDLKTLQNLHAKKTGALIKAAVMMGAAFVEKNNEIQQALDTYSTKIGLAFQVWDDVLDIIGTTEKLGKQVGSDLALNKSTYPSLIGLDESISYAKTCVDEAISSLDVIDADTSLLKSFASFIISRDH